MNVLLVKHLGAFANGIQQFDIMAPKVFFFLRSIMKQSLVFELVEKL